MISVPRPITTAPPQESSPKNTTASSTIRCTFTDGVTCTVLSICRFCAPSTLLSSRLVASTTAYQPFSFSAYAAIACPISSPSGASPARSRPANTLSR